MDLADKILWNRKTKREKEKLLFYQRNKPLKLLKFSNKIQGNSQSGVFRNVQERKENLKNVKIISFSFFFFVFFVFFVL